jgi:membrane protein
MSAGPPQPHGTGLSDATEQWPVASAASVPPPEPPTANGHHPADGFDDLDPATADSPADSQATVILDRAEPEDVDANRFARTYPWHLPGTGPVPTLEGPVRHRWRKVLGRTASKAWGDSLFGMSSQAAFWCALSTAPLLLALLGLVGFVAPLFGPNTIGEIHNQVSNFLPTIFNEDVANLVGNTVDTILNRGQTDVVSVGLVLSFWAGSSAMSAFVESITIAYCQHEVRNPVVERIFSLGLYLITLVCGIFGLPLLAVGPGYLPQLFPVSWRETVGTIVNIAYYPALGIGLLVLLTTLYKVAPKHKHAWKRGLPGAVLAALVFFVASFGLRLYLGYVYTHGLTYGALATPITFLLFYYFISMAIIIGAQFNNALLEYYPPRRSRRELRKWRRYDPARDRKRAAALPASPSEA